MGRASLAILIACIGLATPARADTTQNFIDQCGSDAGDVPACTGRVETVRIEAVKAGENICPPKGISMEGYVNEVAYWIGEQPALDMSQDERKSILAALKSLYTCKPAQGSQP